MSHNILNNLLVRIEEYRATNKNPCKNYATEEAAEKAVAAAAKEAGQRFCSTGESAQYIVLFVPSWGRWVGCMNYSELFSRKTSLGGYIGAIKGFFTF